MQVRSFVEEVWNGRTYELVADLESQSGVNPFGAGPSARVDPIRRYHQTFPDSHLDVRSVDGGRDKAVLKAALPGTDTGGFLGRSPTGRAVEDWMVAITHFQGDRVVREWIGADNLGRFVRLGVVDDLWPTFRITGGDERSGA